MAAPRAGSDLRAARERLGWELDDTAAYLRIQPCYLRALEDGRLNALPANAYALGFLRTYSAALGLEPEETLRRFREEAAEVTRKTELSFPVTLPERGLPAGAAVLLGVFLVAGAYAGWYRLSGEGRLPAETASPVPERLAPLARQAVPPAAINLPTAQPEASVPPPGPAATALDLPTPPAPAVSPASAAAAVNPLAVVPPDTGANKGDQSRLTIRATADTWLQVKDKTGAILLNRVLKPGEVWPVPPKPGLLLTTGNAGGMEFVVDGTTVIGNLGASGAVRRDLPLDVDPIKEGKLAQQAAIPPSRTAQ